MNKLVSDVLFQMKNVAIFSYKTDKNDSYYQVSLKIFKNGTYSYKITESYTDCNESMQMITRTNTSDGTGTLEFLSTGEIIFDGKKTFDFDKIEVDYFYSSFSPYQYFTFESLDENDENNVKSPTNNIISAEELGMKEILEEKVNKELNFNKDLLYFHASARGKTSAYLILSLKNQFYYFKGDGYALNGSFDCFNGNGTFKMNNNDITFDQKQIFNIEKIDASYFNSNHFLSREFFAQLKSFYDPSDHPFSDLKYIIKQMIEFEKDVHKMENRKVKEFEESKQSEKILQLEDKLKNFVLDHNEKENLLKKIEQEKLVKEQLELEKESLIPEEERREILKKKYEMINLERKKERERKEIDNLKGFKWSNNSNIIEGSTGTFDSFLQIGSKIESGRAKWNVKICSKNDVLSSWMDYSYYNLQLFIGICQKSQQSWNGNFKDFQGWGIQNQGIFFNNGNTDYNQVGFQPGDVLTFDLDLDQGTLYISKNNNELDYCWKGIVGPVYIATWSKGGRYKLEIEEVKEQTSKEVIEYRIEKERKKKLEKERIENEIEEKDQALREKLNFNPKDTSVSKKYSIANYSLELFSNNTFKAIADGCCGSEESGIWEYTCVGEGTYSIKDGNITFITKNEEFISTQKYDIKIRPFFSASSDNIMRWELQTYAPFMTQN